jgi:hypothetical protein
MTVGGLIVMATLIAAIELAGGPAGGDGMADVTSAALWIDADGGTCTRASSPAGYNDTSACDTIAEAWAACQAGDTIGIRGGDYSGSDFDLVDGASRSPGCSFVGVNSETVRADSINIRNTDNVELAYIDDTLTDSVDIRDTSGVTIRDSKASVNDAVTQHPAVYTEANDDLLFQDFECTSADPDAHQDCIQVFPRGVDNGTNTGTITFRRVWVHDLTDAIEGGVHTDALQISDGSDVHIEQSRFQGCSTQCVYVNDVGHAQDWAHIGDVTVENSILGDPQSGSASCLFDGSDNIVFRNNVATAGCSFRKDPDEGIRGTVTLTGNYFGGWNSGTGGNFNCLIYMDAADTAADNARPGGATTCGGESGITNVATSVFVDYGGTSSDDLHLAAGTNALVDAMTAGYPDADLDGNERPCGSAGDIGPYERC